MANNTILNFTANPRHVVFFFMKSETQYYHSVSSKNKSKQNVIFVVFKLCLVLMFG